MTTNDVVASLRRIFKVKSPTSGGFYAGIVGADACLKTPATCTLKGGVSANAAAGTVTINLTAPDPEFKYKLAVPHASDPAGEYAPEGRRHEADPRHRRRTCSSRTTRTRSLVMVRNPFFKEWSVKAQPDGYPGPDHADLRADGRGAGHGDPERAGRLDARAAAGRPARRRSARSTRSQVHVTPLTAFWYIPMNTNMAPFNKLKARQAFNFAVDRNAAVKIFGGKNLASPSCQVLPPGFPGHKDYCPYTKNPGTKWSAPDVAKAKKLVKESGTAGQKVTVVVPDDEVNKAMGVYTQSVLNQIGYKASVKAISGNIFFTYRRRTRRTRCRSTCSSGTRTTRLHRTSCNILFGCDSFHPGSDSSINIAGFCDKKIDAQMKHALALASEDEDAANAEWAKIDHAVTDAGSDGHPLQPEARRLRLEARRATSPSASSSTGWSLSRGSSRSRRGGRARRPAPARSAADEQGPAGRNRGAWRRPFCRRCAVGARAATAAAQPGRDGDARPAVG